MRRLRIAGALLVVAALAATPFARDVTLGGGFAIYAAGLLGVILLLRGPTVMHRPGRKDPIDDDDAM